ncbi:polyamine-modulated factor 1-binding protein 1-like isoform X2 [Leptopilina heterotoma]|uniref:polyamine-modulated factor 1-binding protein 1-like isoform X2 n=1 Tax=Leptopilina heterotoma TaxID=63436 RepID=UPI001CA9057A|nr:polyamine-modulated factor 1-binding protein 1-like isoform X2 [Leptopilina heterotoma]
MSSIAAGDSQDSVNCDCLQTSKPPGQSLLKTNVDSSESEKLCETESLKILEKFKRIYENRIDDVDQNAEFTEFERISTKLKIMTEWVEDLKDQNVMLVRTVEDLEKAAVNRVKLLEDKLLQSTNLVSENIAKCANSGEALNTLSDRISELERDEYFENKIEYLQSDIRGLLELIRRAHENSCWNHDGITFYEIKPEDIPVPFDCPCNEIVQVADFLESALVAKDLKIKNLNECLEETNAKLEKLLHENDNFETKNKQIQELEIQLKALQKESLESKEALASEVAEKYDQVIILRREIQELEDKCHHLSMQTQFKEDIIKDLRKELKQISQKDVHQTRHVRINQEPPSEIISEDSSSHKNEIVQYLSKTKQLMEKEKEALSILKEEIEKMTTELRYKQEFREDFPHLYIKLHEMDSLLKTFIAEVIENNGSIEKMKHFFTDIEGNMASLLMILQNLQENSEGKSQITMEEIVNRLGGVTNKIAEICSEKEGTLTNTCTNEETEPCENSCSDPSHELAFKTFHQQFKRMEEFRICTVEAQAATEDLREEMETIISNFTSRHEKNCELNKLTAEVQNYLITTREKISKTISQLKLQGEERRRYNMRISSGNDKLKDMKNEINMARVNFSQYSGNIEGNNQEFGNVDSTQNSSDVLNIVADEVEQIVSNLQAVQEKESCTVSLLTELNTQLSTIDNNLEKFYNKSQEILKANEVSQKVFEEKEKSLDKSEKELDYVHTNMQNALEAISIAIDEINELEAFKDNHIVNQDVNQILKAKDDYHKIRREYENLRMKIVEDSYKKEVDDSVNECKRQITNLLGQIRFLQSELKIGQDANGILESHIQVLEQELKGENKKSEDTRRSFSKECMLFKRKISELESTLWKQKEIESNLRRSLASSEIELKNSKEMLNSFQSSSEGTLSTRGSGVNSENCFAEVEKLKHTLFTKEKMLKDKEEIIKIQQDSIILSQSEVKDLHEKLQEKIDAQNNVISHLDKENKQLQNKIELQVQTIGHLQNAVVQTKRCLDQMGQKFVSDVSELWSSVSPSVFNHGNVHDV